MPVDIAHPALLPLRISHRGLQEGAEHIKVESDGRSMTGIFPTLTSVEQYTQIPEKIIAGSGEKPAGL